jgi:hypothetical protein
MYIAVIPKLAVLLFCELRNLNYTQSRVFKFVITFYIALFR